MGGTISQQRWIEVKVRTPKQVKDQVGECLKMYSKTPIRVCQEEGSPLWLVTGGLWEDAAISRRLEGLESALQRLEKSEGVSEPLFVDLEAMSVSTAERVGKQVAAYAGSRLVVCSLPDTVGSFEGKHVVCISPGQAFGDGRHPSTVLALRLLETYLEGGNGAMGKGKVLDAGCGTGILSLAAAALGDFQVLGVDISNDAIIAAKVNQRNNSEAGRRVHFVRGAFSCARGPFCIVMANLVASVHTGAFESLWSATTLGGRLILSGFSLAQKDLVVRPYLKKGAEEIAFSSEQDWVGVVLRRPVNGAQRRAGDE